MTIKYLSITQGVSVIISSGKPPATEPRTAQQTPPIHATLEILMTTWLDKPSTNKRNKIMLAHRYHPGSHVTLPKGLYSHYSPRGHGCRRRPEHSYADISLRSPSQSAGGVTSSSYSLSSPAPDSPLAEVGVQHLLCRLYTHTQTYVQVYGLCLWKARTW